MKNQATEPIVVYLLLPYLTVTHGHSSDAKPEISEQASKTDATRDVRP